MRIYITSKGNFKNTERFFKNSKSLKLQKILERYGREGVNALSSATPYDTGKTAGLWDYRIVEKRGGSSVEWINQNSEYGVPVVILLQYGHGTPSGNFIQGYDFVNPAIRPIFDRIINDLEEEVRKL